MLRFKAEIELKFAGSRRNLAFSRMQEFQCIDFCFLGFTFGGIWDSDIYPTPKPSDVVFFMRKTQYVDETAMFVYCTGMISCIRCAKEDEQDVAS